MFVCLHDSLPSLLLASGVRHNCVCDLPWDADDRRPLQHDDVWGDCESRANINDLLTCSLFHYNLQSY